MAVALPVPGADALPVPVALPEPVPVVEDEPVLVADSDLEPVPADTAVMLLEPVPVTDAVCEGDCVWVLVREGISTTGSETVSNDARTLGSTPVDAL